MCLVKSVESKNSSIIASFYTACCISVDDISIYIKKYIFRIQFRDTYLALCSFSWIGSRIRADYVKYKHISWQLFKKRIRLFGINMRKSMRLPKNYLRVFLWITVIKFITVLVLNYILDTNVHKI